MPFDSWPPGPGHNSRYADIDRTARELDDARLRFIRAQGRTNIPYDALSFRWRVLCYAVAAEVEPSAIVELIVQLGYADRDGKNSSASHETRAKVRGCSIRTCKYDTSKLEVRGFLPPNAVKHRKQNSAVRAITIPQVILDAFPITE
jgi:hypothetical protein